MGFSVKNGSIGLLALFAAACGGGAQMQAKTGAEANAAATPQGPPAVATTSNGQQFAVADTGPAGPASGRPEMNASAAQAYQAGLQAFQTGDLAGAKAQFSRAVDADPKAYQADYSLGVVQERLGQKSAALAAYRASLSLVKDFEPAIAATALLMARTGDVSEAEDFLNRERATLPNSAAVLASLAEVKSIQKDSASAQSLAQEALKKNPDYRPAMLTLARDHYRNRRLDLALYTLTAILDGYGPENPPRDKDNAEALLLRGLIYKEQGRRRDAFADFQRANQLRPDLIEAKINLARYMLDAGNATEAGPLLENALGYDSANTIIHLDLGDAYRLQGRPADALKHFQWVLSKDPTVAEVHYNLGLLYLFSKDVPGVSSPTASIDKAIAELQQFKSMRPRTKAGSGDDVDELIARAQNKKAVLAAEAAAPPPDASGGAAPATPAQGAAAPAGAATTSAAKPATGAPSGASGALPPVGAPPPANTTPPAGATPPAAGGGAKAPAAPAAPAGSAGSSAAFPTK